MITPSIFGGLIIMVVYLPILTLTGVEGKMFVPMAFTVLFALTGAMIFALTFVPAAVAIFLTGKVSEKENRVIGVARRMYEPLLQRSLRATRLVVAGAACLVVASLFLAAQMGREFIPSLDEGDVLIQPVRIAGTSVTQSAEMSAVLEKRFLQIPEVKEVFTRIGTAEVASDPMPPNTGDCYIMLKPRAEWPDPAKSKAAVVEDLTTAAAEVPGSNYEVTQPIQMRFNELISGVRSDVGVKIFGDDMEVLRRSADEVAKVLRTVPGNDAVKVEQITGLPMLTVKFKRTAMARYGLTVSEVQDVIQAAIGGKETGALFEGDRRFPIVVRLPENLRTDMDALRRLPIALPRSETSDESVQNVALDRPAFIPLGEVAELDEQPGPNQISRENGKRRIVVTCNIRGRDIGSFVAEAQQKMRAEVKLEPGYWIAWGGQFEQLQSATKRLQIVVPLALLLIFVLLFMAFGSVKDSLLVFSGVPLALTGGILALWLRDIPLSISAGVGFIALSGVAVLNGVVMVSFINQLRREGETAR